MGTCCPKTSCSRSRRSPRSIFLPMILHRVLTCTITSKTRAYYLLPVDSRKTSKQRRSAFSSPHSRSNWKPEPDAAHLHLYAYGLPCVKAEGSCGKRFTTSYVYTTGGFSFLLGIRHLFSVFRGCCVLIAGILLPELWNSKSRTTYTTYETEHCEQLDTSPRL